MVFKRKRSWKSSKRPYKRRRTTALKRRPYRKRRFMRGKRRLRRRGGLADRANIAQQLLKKKQFFKGTHCGMVTILNSDVITTHTNGPAAMGYTLRANSIYDPSTNVTGSFNGVATQKEFFGKLYNHYTVLGSRVTFTLTQRSAPTTNTAGVAVMPLVWGVKLDDDATFSSGGKHWPQLRSDPLNKIKVFHPDYNMGKSQSITHSFSAKKFFNTKDPCSDNTLYAAFTANPTEQAYFIPWMELGEIDGAAVTVYPSFTLTWKLDIFCAVHEPKDLDASTVGADVMQGD